MTVVINKENLKNTPKILSERLKKVSGKGNLMMHFGKLKRGIDGLDYQKLIRKSEN